MFGDIHWLRLLLMQVITVAVVVKGQWEVVVLHFLPHKVDVLLHTAFLVLVIENRFDVYGRLHTRLDLRLGNGERHLLLP